MSKMGWDELPTPIQVPLEARLEARDMTVITVIKDGDTTITSRTIENGKAVLRQRVIPSRKKDPTPKAGA